LPNWLVQETSEENVVISGNSIGNSAVIRGPNESVPRCHWGDRDLLTAVAICDCWRIQNALQENDRGAFLYVGISVDVLSSTSAVQGKWR